VDGPARDDHTPGALRAARVLVLEDSFLILMELESILLEAGADAVCTCRSVGEALRTIAEKELGAAILDLQLDGETSMPVARALSERGVPFFFYTGQLDTRGVRAEWPACLVVAKPADSRKIVEMVASLVAA
jgi:DNA-binding response OmpR family regulator